MLTGIPTMDEFRELHPEGVLERLRQYRLTPKTKLHIANRLFLEGSLDVDGHGVVMNGLNERTSI